jgi:hypothetical protein
LQHGFHPVGDEPKRTALLQITREVADLLVEQKPGRLGIIRESTPPDRRVKRELALE